MKPIDNERTGSYMLQPYSHHHAAASANCRPNPMAVAGRRLDQEDINATFGLEYGYDPNLS